MYYSSVTLIPNSPMLLLSCATFVWKEYVLNSRLLNNTEQIDDENPTMHEHSSTNSSHFGELQQPSQHKHFYNVQAE